MRVCMCLSVCAQAFLSNTQFPVIYVYKDTHAYTSLYEYIYISIYP